MSPSATGRRWSAPTAPPSVIGDDADRRTVHLLCGPAPCSAPTASSARSSRRRTRRVRHRHQGPAPDLRRRRRHRRAEQYRRVQRIRQLRRRDQTAHHHRLACPHRFRHHVRRAGHRRRRRLHRGGHRGARRRTARCAGRVGGPAAQYRGLGGTQATWVCGCRGRPASNAKPAKTPDPERQPKTT